MALQDKLIARYGDPTADLKAFESKWMTLWDIPLWINTHIPCLPNRVYINKDMVAPLQSVLEALIQVGLYKEINNFAGIYAVRLQRGSSTKLSLHSFGLAIDLNPQDNQLGVSKADARAKGLHPFSDTFDDVWRAHGFTVGFDWKRPDGMHREYTKHLS